MSLSAKTRVAVLRGGPSTGYKDSLKTGEYVLRTLREMPDYEQSDIFISKDGEWHKGGVVVEPHRVLRQSDVVWNAMHGSYGEDGQIQSFLDNLQVPYTGANTMAAIMAMNKDMTKRLYRDNDMLTPSHTVITRDNFEDEIINAFRNYNHPVVKPLSSSGSLGVERVYNYRDLRNAVERNFQYSPKVLVEEYIGGHEVVCTVIEGAKGQRLYSLIPHVSTGGSVGSEETSLIEKIAKKAHDILGLRHYSSSDFIVTPRKKIYILETNALPVLHDYSDTHKALLATGWRQHDLVSHCINLALGRN